MKKQLLFATLTFLTFLHVCATITSLQEARMAMRYLGVIKQHNATLFSDPLVIETVHELVNFCEHNNRVCASDRLELLARVEEFISLIPSDSGAGQFMERTNPLSANGQTLVTYWSQIFSSTSLLFDTTGNNTVALSAPLVLDDSYSVQFPVSVGQPDQVLATLGGNPAQLTWITTVTNSAQLNLLYTATSADIPLTLVLRDSTGSFAATNVTLTGNLILPDQTGALVANAGLVTTTVGIDGTRLASFPTTSPATPVTFFQPVEPTRELYFFDDFIAFNRSKGALFYGDTPWVIGFNGAARVSSQAPSGNAMGITRITTDGTNSSNYLIKQTTPTVAQSLLFGQGVCFNEWCVALPTVSSYVVAVVGICDTLVTFGPLTYPTNGIYFSNTGGVWSLNAANNGTTTTVATTVSPSATVFQRLGFNVNALGNRVDFYINGGLVGTITSNIPTSGCSPLAYIGRTGGGAALSLDIDYWYLHYTFSSLRASS